MAFCRECKDHILFSKNDDEATAMCSCEIYTVVDEEGDTYQVRAKSLQEAALKFAEKSNQDCDYYLMDNSVEILVDGTRFCISAEPDVYYSATEL